MSRKLVLKTHAAFLICLTSVLTLLAYAGPILGIGPYGSDHFDPLAVIGIVQAYPLMGLVAVAIWMGANGPAPSKFSLLAIVAHSIPLMALFVFWVPINQGPIAPFVPLSLMIHGGWITIEMASLGFLRGNGGASAGGLV